MITMNTHRCHPRHRFPIDIISQCVWLYFRFFLSYRDVEEMMAERGVTVNPAKLRFSTVFLLHGFRRFLPRSPRF